LEVEIMATSRRKAAAEPESSDVAEAEPQAGPHPPMSAFRQVWVHHRDVALANNQVGFIWALRADAQAMIDAGNAVDPYVTLPLPFIGAKPAPPPIAVVAITGITAANPPIATVSAADRAKLTNGMHLRLDATAGDPDAQTAVDGTLATVGGLTATTFTLIGVNTAAVDVTGLVATATEERA
jgi:hypothetical protein